jgi:mannitol/fructose-specific phosphotransferase system IIA component (Ntr-type)
MLLSSYLDAQTIYFEASPKTKEEVYSEMVGRICRLHKLPTCGKKLVDLILARDAESSTAYSSGISIPHVRMHSFNDTLISICLLTNPIDYDGIPVKLVVLIITDTSSSKLYLNIVSALLKLSKDADAIAMLNQAKDGHGVIQTLKQLNIAVKDKVTIGDIMISNPVSILPEATLRDLGNKMSEYKVAGLPVVDKDMNYLGEVDVLNLLKVGIPDYMLMMDHLGFLSNFEPLEKLFATQDVKTVKDIMSTEDEPLKSTDSVIEAVFEMIQHKKRLFSVVDNGKLVGVITAMDVFKKVFKA